MANNIGSYFGGIGGPSTAGYTIILPGYMQAATNAGTLTTVDAFVSVAGSYTFKVFHDDGTNYNLVGSQSVTLAAGANRGIAISIAGVSTGDFLALYCPGGGGGVYGTAITEGELAAYYLGNAGTMTKASWTAIGGNYAYSAAGFVTASGASQSLIQAPPVRNDAYYWANGVTVLDKYKSPIAGNWTSVKYAAYGGCQLKCKVFRDDGTNYNWIADSDQWVATGSGIETHIFTTPLAVQAGDLFGYYATSGYGGPNANIEWIYDMTDYALMTYAGDVTSAHTKASWTTTLANASVRMQNRLSQPNNIGSYFGSGTGSESGYTQILAGSAQLATVAGTLTSVDVYVTGACNGAKIKVFHSNGTNLDLVGEQTVNLVSGANVGVPVNIAGVQVGDILGLYIVYGQYPTVYSHPGTSDYEMDYQAGDIGTGPKSSFSAQSGYEYGFGGYIQSAAGGLVNNIDISGVWKTVTENKICISGAWKVITELKIAIGGVWKTFA